MRALIRRLTSSILVIMLASPALAGHLVGGVPQGVVHAVCLDEGTAMELAPLSDNEFKLGILRTEGCFRLGGPVPSWMTRIVDCVVNADDVDVCVIEVHNFGGSIAYTWIVGTEEQIAPLMGNWRALPGMEAR